MLGARISHYRIDARLGAGGMGEVFLAHDVALGRPAAIKVLADAFQPELRQRLIAEAEYSSRLQHPGIATFFEGGEDGGIAYIAMEFVQGETLRRRLLDGAFSREETIATVTALLEALGHAHAAGVVHRDIKPENIMITTRGETKLLDFGIALRPAVIGPIDGEVDQATRTQLTAAGSILGSPGYMAPEQLTGEGIDARTDLFAVGAVLYEALSGIPAFPGNTASARLAAMLARDPAPLPPRLSDFEPIARRALDRDRNRRYESAAQMLKDLRKATRGEPVVTYPETIAVLDFTNRTGAADSDWIGGGISESLAADLSRYERVIMIPRAKIQRAAAAGSSTDPIRLAKQLGARYLLQGSYQSAGAALRIVMEVFEVVTERTLAHEKLDGATEDLFALQDELARRAAAALAIEAAGTASPARRPEGLAAYECYTRGRALWTRMTKGGFDEAQELFERAIDQDARYADALAALAGLHDMRFTFTTDRDELDRAKEYASRAIEADPEHADAHVWLAYAMWRRGLAPEALLAIGRAGELAPQNGYPPYFRATILQSLDRAAEAIPHYQRAVSLMPVFGFAWVGLGNAQMEAGDAADALWVFEKGIELESKGYHATAGADGYAGECLRRQGRLEEARARCLAGLASVERTDHMYRDTFRAICLNALGRTAIDQDDREAARSAFLQCTLHLEGRPSTLGGGFLMTQALAGKAYADADTAGLQAAEALFAERGRFDWSWLWLCESRTTAADLARARNIEG